MGQDSLEQLQEMWDSFLKDATKNAEKGNKSAGRRARIKSVELRQSLKDWRTENLS